VVTWARYHNFGNMVYLTMMTRPKRVKCRFLLASFVLLIFSRTSLLLAVIALSPKKTPQTLSCFSKHKSVGQFVRSCVLRS
jgi:hypothetical protein